MARSALILFIAGLLQPTTAFSRALIVPHRTVHVPLISSPTASSIAANPIKTSTAAPLPRLNLCRAARVAYAHTYAEQRTLSLYDHRGCPVSVAGQGHALEPARDLVARRLQRLDEGRHVFIA